MAYKKVSLEDLVGPLNAVERKHAPSALYISGDIKFCRDYPRVSVIGTRDVSSDGAKRARDLTRILVSQGITVVSGLARGVDTCAHKGAVEYGGKTIAVLGTPLDESYPAENADLQKLIMAEHLAVSQFSNDMAVRRNNFPIRNRTMALISHATVIVEAGDGSGTLHQGWEALRLGRPLFIMESLTRRNDLKWPKEMLEYGAQTLSRDKMDILFEFLPQDGAGVELAELPF